MYIWKNISASLRRKKNDVQALLYSTWKEQYGWFIEERLISININISSSNNYNNNNNNYT